MGIYDKATFLCRVCKKKTLHETGWESESPECLEEKCLTCGRHEIADTRSFPIKYTPVTEIKVK